MRNRIKDIIKNNYYMRMPLLIYRYIFNSDFKDWVNSYGSNSLLIHRYGNQNDDKTIYYIKCDNPSCGFFAYWKLGIVGLNYAEKHNLTPVIDWTSSSPYYEPNKFGEKSNPFLYYFNPISSIDATEILQSKYVLFADLARDAIGKFSKEAFFYDFNNPIEEYVRINKKYFSIRNDVFLQMKEQIDCLLQGKNVLGVHIRGVEWGNIKDHPIPASLQSFFSEIKNVISTYGYEKVFVATDSEETLNQCKNVIKEKLITFNDVQRSLVGSKTLMIFDKSIIRENNHYLMGLEVLRDMLMLSYCDALIASFSNVGLAARVFKESRGENYRVIKIIKPKGICSRGMTANKAIKKMKKGTF